MLSTMRLLIIMRLNARSVMPANPGVRNVVGSTATHATSYSFPHDCPDKLQSQLQQKLHITCCRLHIHPCHVPLPIAPQPLHLLHHPLISTTNATEPYLLFYDTVAAPTSCAASSHYINAIVEQC
jgi:hypothetical protein